MIIKMQESEKFDFLSFKNGDLLIHGEVLDDRGEEAVDSLKKRTTSFIAVDYLPENYELFINEKKRLNSEDLEFELAPYKDKEIIIEGSTLGFVEIFLCCKALKNLGIKNIKIFYVEPSYYSTPRRFQVLHKRDFDLSEEFPGFNAIPGAVIRLSDRRPQKGVFFLGYEERRLARALEDYQMISPSQCSVVFGVPAFQAGWEMNAFANNLPVIRDQNIRGGIHYCGAENPLSVVRFLENLYESLADGERLFIGPLGTKPNGIGVALFAVGHSDIGLLYDHPKRKRGRSEKVAKWHLYEIGF